MRIAKWMMAACLVVASGFAGAAGPKVDGEWGKVVRGVTIRARAEKTVWNVAETPVVVLDLSIDKKTGAAVARMPWTEVEVDGKWYVSRTEQPVAGYIEMHGATTWDKYTTVRLDDRWVIKPAGYRRGKAVQQSDRSKLLILTAGKHTIRVQCLVDGREPISNPVEIEVAAR